jgi:hypothetical protein
VSEQDDVPVEPSWKDDVNAPIEAEIGLLGAALVDETGAAAKVLFGVPSEDFSDSRAAAVAHAMPSAMNGHPAPDIIALASVLRESGEASAVAFLLEHLRSHPTGANAELYAERIRFFADRRRERALRQRLADAKTQRAQDRAKDDLDDFLAAREETALETAVVTTWDFAATLDDPDPPPAVQFVRRLFVRPSLNIVFGPAQAGKSWATMALCLDAVMGGGEFLGSQDLTISPLRDGIDVVERCLWVFGNEDTEGRVRRRLRLLRDQGPHAGETVRPGTFIYATPPGGASIHSEEGWKWLLREIETHQPSIVVLDTLASLTANTLDVNKQEEVAPFLSQLNVLRAARNLVIFLLHHTRKASSDGKKNAASHADTMLGSGAFRSLSEGVLMLDAQDGDTSKVTVRSIKAKDIEDHVPSFHVTMMKGTGRFRMLDQDETPPAPEPVQKSTKGGRPAAVTAEQIVGLRAKFPDGVAWREIAGHLKVADGTWKNHSSRLQDELLKQNHVVVGGVLRWSNA